MDLEQLIREAGETARTCQDHIDDVVRFNVDKVLQAFRDHRVADLHLQSSTGYGYNDHGRDTLEEIYAQVFRTEDALVRQQIVSGTHAISLALFGVLLPGDELLSLGQPYDTLQKVIGSDAREPGTLREMGITYREISLGSGAVDPEKVAAAVSPATKMLCLQRSKGYAWRPSLSVAQIGGIIQAVKRNHPRVVIFVDNCYGEFVEKQEPSEVGADLMAGSLIKNPGGGIAPGGGYLVGRRDLVERAAYRLTAPGVGKEIGPSLGSNRLYYQGLFLAPQVVGEAISGAVFAADLFSHLGMAVLPEAAAVRSDIVQAIRLGSRERVIAFCREIQRYSPVDSHVSPEPWDMPGYENQVIMAAGAFVQGSSIELSADAPMREPYIVYLQGGLSRHHSRIAVTAAAKAMQEAGLL